MLKSPLRTTSFGNLGYAALEVSASSSLNDDSKGVSNVVVQRFLSTLLSNCWEPVAHNEAHSSRVGNRPLLCPKGDYGNGNGAFPNKGPMHGVSTGNERSCLDGRYPWRCDS